MYHASVHPDNENYENTEKYADRDVPLFDIGFECKELLARRGAFHAWGSRLLVTLKVSWVVEKRNQSPTLRFSQGGGSSPYRYG